MCGGNILSCGQYGATGGANDASRTTGRAACVWIDDAGARVFELDGDAQAKIFERIADGDVKDGPSFGTLTLSLALLADIAGALAGARRIMILGPGKARILLTGWLHQEHPRTARRIVASGPCNDQPDADIVACAHGFFESDAAVRA